MSLVLVIQSLKIHRVKKEGFFQLLFLFALGFFAWFNLYPIGDATVLEALNQVSDKLLGGDFAALDVSAWLRSEHLLYLAFQLVLQGLGIIISWIYLYLFLGGQPTYQLKISRILRLVGYFAVLTLVFFLGLITLFIPFIIFYFLTYYAAPLLMTEDIALFKAMRKSYFLMKTNFSVILIGNILINLFMRLFSLILLFISPNQFAAVLFGSFLMVVLLCVRGRFRGLLFDSFYRRPIINYSRGLREQEPEEVLNRLLKNLNTEASAEDIAAAQLRRREEEAALQQRLQDQLKVQLLKELQILQDSEKKDE